MASLNAQKFNPGLPTFIPQSLQNQCNMIFKIIMFSNNSKSQIMTGSHLSTFIKHLNDNISESDAKQHGSQIINHLNDQQLPLDTKNFSKLLSQKLKIYFLNNQTDIKDFHQKFKRLLLNQAYYDLDMIQKWDINFQTQNIVSLRKRIKQWIGQKQTFPINSLQKRGIQWYINLNSLLIIISYGNESNIKLTKELYLKIFEEKIYLQVINNLININDDQTAFALEYLKILSYLYTSAKYQGLKRKLDEYQKQPNFPKSNLWKMLLLLCDSQIMQIRSQAIVILTMLCKYHNTFAYDLFQQGQYLYTLICVFTKYNIQQGTFQALQFLNAWLCKVKNKLNINITQGQKQMIESLRSFAMNILFQKNIRVYQRIYSLQLIKQLLIGTKLTPNEDLILQMRKIQLLFVEPNSIIIGALIQFVLEAINTQNNTLTEIFIHSGQIRYRLISQLSNKQSKFHIACLSYLLEISKTKYRIYLLDQKYIQILIKYSQFCDMSSNIILCTLFSRLIQTSVQKESKLFMLLQYQIVKTLLLLAQRFTSTSSATQNYFPNLDLKFYDIDILISCFVSFYMLFSSRKGMSSDDYRRKFSKFREVFKEEHLILLKQLCDLIFDRTDREFIHHLLNYQIELEIGPDNKSIKFVKFLSIIYEELSIIFINQPLQKHILNLKNIYCEKFYMQMDFIELQKLNIPLMFLIGIEHQGRLISATTFRKSSLEYLTNFVIYRTQNSFKQKIKSIELKDLYTNQILVDDLTYKKSIRSAIDRARQTGVKILLKLTISTIISQTNEAKSLKINLNHLANEEDDDSLEDEDTQFIVDMPSNFTGYAPGGNNQNVSRRTDNTSQNILYMLNPNNSMNQSKITNVPPSSSQIQNPHTKSQSSERNIKSIPSNNDSLTKSLQIRPSKKDLGQSLIELKQQVQRIQKLYDQNNVETHSKCNICGYALTNNFPCLYCKRPS